MGGKVYFSFKTYLIFIILSFFHPNKFSKKAAKLSKNKRSFSANKLGILYFFINIQFGLLLFGLIKVYASKNSDIFSPSLVFFPTMSEIIFITPLIGFGFISFIIFLHLIAKFVGGVGSLKSTLLSSAWMSAPLIFIWVPYIQAAAIILQIYLLIEGFGLIHHYPKKIAFANILMPLSGIYFILFALNSFNKI
ncbi:MAG: hypothetical protein ACD_30C00110G0020 [uncultured bacterium]|uniref:Yip1 domain-containing protein n=2 Tax=Candidatus Daviesiibacteriota TaxID=1752718 RepID=A0A1F5K5F9_9BACT|nr:MAG: hypothetical protein ACD_30C00110G0020 [uncultured bacterium]KKQ15175.1 MAG: hypothetical protein US28_C0021G0006 [Candidatus Daviesbacteria bacterium GW2011_GWA1_36_8]OGE33028.1 MAG: hypothetical protein A3C99_02020 [Candidatus Daviesbacteria bacterium RIFCSPHIGHO2_02_FULL_37_9]OGE36222.1 MAG: hypothetical protein A3E66_05460 [Candidatus Daviesbacteria bacterium RIFCSPHIGHO2_12_FULL_37_16]